LQPLPQLLDAHRKGLEILLGLKHLVPPDRITALKSEYGFQRNGAEPLPQVDENILQTWMELESDASAARVIPDLVHPGERDPLLVFLVPESQRPSDQLLAGFPEKLVNPAAVGAHNLSDLQNANLMFSERVVFSLNLSDQPKYDPLLVNAQGIPGFSDRICPDNNKVAIRFLHLGRDSTLSYLYRTSILICPTWSGGKRPHAANIPTLTLLLSLLMA